MNQASIRKVASLLLNAKRSAGWLLLGWILLALGAGQLPTLKAAEGPEYYPGKLRIKKAKRLLPEEREIEARFARYLEENTDEAIAVYRERFGKEINSDNVRELSKDYAPGGIGSRDSKTKIARARWSEAVYEPSSSLAREIYRRELKKPAGPKEINRAVFTAGGAGVGKTTSIRRVAGLAHAVELAQIVYDTTLSSWNSAVERITQALDAKKTVSIIFIYRDPVEAFVGGVLPRAENDGRTLPMNVFIATHIGAPNVVLKLAERYRDETRIEIAIIDNTRGRGEAVVADLEFVRRVAGRYTSEELQRRLSRALEDAYEKDSRGEKGAVWDAVYRGFKSRVP